ncbi:MAG TPA: ankyrin repeat domain-containing protein [Sedimentisphaerales bacterium]|nr:ankyrin repeat domain-containing protein [Sedimentisphaerales bacterium]HRS12371.1 ankyrin repeat domain-containing protein [Sedimentisphaerales bacterium]HRV48911.1 ankyrin repeat domain-containing protein [Sedimentisphaerales bacterium]
MDALLNEVVRYLAAQSWQIAVLTLVVATATWALRHKTAHIRYLLWLIVLAKCLVPPFFTVPLKILPQAVSEMVPSMLAPPVWRGEHPAFSGPAPVETRDSQRPEPTALPPVPPPRPRHLSTSGWVGLLWIAGAGTYLMMNLLRAVRGHYWLRRTRRPLPPDFERDIANLLGVYPVRNMPRIWIMEGVGQPFVWGLLRGSIYVPPGFLSIQNPQHRRDVLAHELSHIVRLDAAVNLLQVIAQAAFWFHPLVWWANCKIRWEREKCCDEMAIAYLDAKPKDYSSVIVNVLIQAQEAAQAVPSLAVAGPVKNIEERIRTMLKPGKRFYRRPSLTGAGAILFATLLTVPTALVLTSRAQTEAPTRSPTPRSTPLHEAARNGDIATAKTLIANGTDVNAKDTSRLETMGMTALHYAVMNGHKDIVELLIASGADLNIKSQEGDTPVDLAVLYSLRPQGKEIFRLLVEKGARVSAIHAAAYLGDVDKLRTLLDQGTNVDARWDRDTTPLFFAVIGGQHEAARLLIDRGADINARQMNSPLPLLRVAVQLGDSAMVRLLIDMGADIEAGKEPGTNVLSALEWNMMSAVNSIEPGKDKVEAARLWWESKRDIVNLVLAKGGSMPPRLAAVGASLGLKEPVELALSEGTDVNRQGQAREDKTFLHEAVESGQKELVQYLLDKGANIEAKERQGLTPLHKASAAGKKDIVELLLAKGADVNATDLQGATPLWYARKGDHREIAELLSRRGAREEAPAVSEQASAISLHAAAKTNNLELVKSLVSKGADVNAMDDRWAATPLHLAAYYNRIRVVEFLISKGANVNALNKWNRTPLDEAVDQNRVNVVEMLRQRGAKLGSSLETRRPKPAKSVLESAAYKYSIPRRNLEIPESMQPCAANLQKIYAAIKKYEKDKGTLPAWLSDLVPDYVSKETLLCPHNPVSSTVLDRYNDPRLPCSYAYEFSMGRPPFRSSSGVTHRDWKIAQVKVFGDVVPLVRCFTHGSINTSCLNIDVTGRVYLSQMGFEDMFGPESMAQRSEFKAQKDAETEKLLEGSPQ